MIHRDLSLIKYDETPCNYKTEGNQAVLVMPTDAETEQEFIDALHRVFLFPHRSKSWNAINEWMIDLDWIWGEEADIPRKKIVILHNDLPRNIGKRPVVFYIENLIHGVENLKRYNVEVVPVFPISTKN